jgi:hypothetical protein
MRNDMIPFSQYKLNEWLENIMKVNPDRLKKRVYGHLYGESYNYAIQVIKNNNSNSVRQVNPTTNTYEFKVGEYGSIYVKENDFKVVSDRELKEHEDEINSLMAE